MFIVRNNENIELTVAELREASNYYLRMTHTEDVEDWLDDNGYDLDNIDSALLTKLVDCYEEELETINEHSTSDWHLALRNMAYEFTEALEPLQK